MIDHEVRSHGSAAAEDAAVEAATLCAHPPPDVASSLCSAHSSYPASADAAAARADTKTLPQTLVQDPANMPSAHVASIVATEKALDSAAAASPVEPLLDEAEELLDAEKPSNTALANSASPHRPSQSQTTRLSHAESSASSSSPQPVPPQTTRPQVTPNSSAGPPRLSRPQVSELPRAASRSPQPLRVSDTSPRRIPSAAAVVAQGYREKIEAIYREHDPERLGDAEQLLKTHEGQEKKLYETVCAQYGVGQASGDGNLSQAEGLTPQFKAILEYVDRFGYAAVAFKDGFTALHLGASSGRSDICDRLLRCGADAAARDASGRTAADVARASGHAQLAAALSRLERQAGNSPLPRRPEGRPPEPLHAAP